MQTLSVLTAFTLVKCKFSILVFLLPCYGIVSLQEHLSLFELLLMSKFVDCGERLASLMHVGIAMV